MKSQTPTWALIVGIMMMLIGGCGIKNDVQYINIRSLIGMKDKIFEKIEKAQNEDQQKNSIESSIESDSTDRNEVSSGFGDTLHLSRTDTLIESKQVEKNDVKDLFGELMDIPEDIILLMIRVGYIGLLFSFLYIVGGLFLLIKKPFSLRLVYAALGANIAFSIFKWIVLSGQGGGLLSISNSVGAAFSIFSCIIFIIIIVSCDKSYYEEIYTD